MNSATVVSRRIRARSGEGERLREEILTATEQLLLELGDDGAVSVRAVAERVGCTAPSIYMHFDDKTDLLFEVCSRVFRALDEDIAAATSELAGTVEATYVTLLAVQENRLLMPRLTRTFCRLGVNPRHCSEEQYHRDGSTALDHPATPSNHVSPMRQNRWYAEMFHP